MDSSKSIKFRKSKLNTFWQYVRPFSAHPDIMLDITSCSMGIRNILISKSHRGQGSNPSSQISVQLTSTYPTSTVQHCQISHQGRKSWLVVQHQGAGKEMKCNLEYAFSTGFLFPDFGWTNPTVSVISFLLHEFTSVGKRPTSWAELLYLVFGIRNKRETVLLLFYTCITDLGWIVICCNWELSMRGSHSDFTQAGLAI